MWIPVGVDINTEDVLYDTADDSFNDSDMESKVVEIIKGNVAKVFSKKVQTRKGPKTAYSLKVDGYDKWLNAGFSAPDVSEGDYVTIKAEENERGFMDIKNVEVSTAPARGASKGAAAVSAGSGSDSRQSSIHYQSSRKDAIEVVQLLLSKDALPISAATSKAGVAKRYEEIMAIIDKLTVRYYQDVETLRVLEDVTDEGEDDDDGDEEGEDADDTDEGDDE